MREYSHNGLAGCVVQSKARTTGGLVGVYHAGQAGLESDPATPWATVCEAHNSICVHTSLALARSHASDPAGWCEWCRLCLIENRQGQFARYIEGVGVEFGEREKATPLPRDVALTLAMRLTARANMYSRKLAAAPATRLNLVALDSDDIDRIERNGEARAVLDSIATIREGIEP